MSGWLTRKKLIILAGVVLLLFLVPVGRYFYVRELRPSINRALREARGDRMIAPVLEESPWVESGLAQLAQRPDDPSAETSERVADRESEAASLKALLERHREIARDGPHPALVRLRGELTAILEIREAGEYSTWTERIPFGMQDLHLRGVVGDYPQGPEAEAASKAILQFHRELSNRGIDLIFLPIPDPIRLYPELFVDDWPDGLLARPGYTEFLLELSESGVEILDLFEEFRAESERTGQYLFEPYDHHWGQDAIRLTAEALTERLERYEFVRGAAAERGRFSFEKHDLLTPRSMQRYLTEESKRDIPKRTPQEVVLFDGQVCPLDPQSPILVMGDSFVLHLSTERTGSSGDFASYLSSRVGLPVMRHGRGANASQVPKDYLELFAHDGVKRRVLVWVTHSGAQHNADWPIVHLDREARESATQLASGGTAQLRLQATSDLPDPETEVYEDAVAATRALLLDPSSADEKQIILYHWVMRDLRLTPESGFHSGQVIRAELEPWEDAIKRAPELVSVMLIDSFDDFETPVYWLSEWSPAEK